ncbi:MAG: class I SAM-dependent methyltransferase [Chloroflexi bacterium]|nr:class I SAM-dependent methyltransferase [Chloroflexota bacterium]
MFKDGKPTQNFPQYYDSHIDITIPYYHTFNIEIINLVKAACPEPALWLDTGCGTGTLVGKALQVFSGTQFILVDPSSEMMAVAKSKLESKYSSRVSFLEMSTTQEIILPGDKKPDVITAVMCHHYLREKGRVEATRKCYELLKPGGLFITFENIRPFTLPGTDIGKTNWGNFQIAAGKSIAETENHIKRFGVEYFPITVEQHLALLRDSGFKVVELLWYSYMQAGFYCIK